MLPEVRECLVLLEIGRDKGLWRRYGPASILVLDFWPPELLENKFLMFQATQFVTIFFNSSSRKPIFNNEKPSLF